MADDDRIETSSGGVRKGLADLTDTDGPLYKLVKEVKTSNEMARKNVKLQRWSLALLALNLVAMAFMTFIVLMVVGVFFDTKNAITDVVGKTEDLFELAQEEKQTRPEVVVDEDTGAVSLVATVKADKTITEPASVTPPPKVLESKARPKPRPAAVRKAKKAAPPPPAPAPAPNPIAEMLGKVKVEKRDASKPLDPEPEAKKAPPVKRVEIPIERMELK